MGKTKSKKSTESNQEKPLDLFYGGMTLGDILRKAEAKQATKEKESKVESNDK